MLTQKWHTPNPHYVEKHNPYKNLEGKSVTDIAPAIYYQQQPIYELLRESLEDPNFKTLATYFLSKWPRLQTLLTRVNLDQWDCAEITEDYEEYREEPLANIVSFITPYSVLSTLLLNAYTTTKEETQFVLDFWVYRAPKPTPSLHTNRILQNVRCSANSFAQPYDTSMDPALAFGLEPKTSWGVFRASNNELLYACCLQAYGSQGCWAGQTKHRYEPYSVSIGEDQWENVDKRPDEAGVNLSLTLNKGTQFLEQSFYERLHKDILRSKNMVENDVQVAILDYLRDRYAAGIVNPDLPYARLSATKKNMFKDIVFSVQRYNKVQNVAQYIPKTEQAWNTYISNEVLGLKYAGADLVRLFEYAWRGDNTGQTKIIPLRRDPSVDDVNAFIRQIDDNTFGEDDVRNVLIDFRTFIAQIVANETLFSGANQLIRRYNEAGCVDDDFDEFVRQTDNALGAFNNLKDTKNDFVDNVNRVLQNNREAAPVYNIEPVTNYTRNYANQDVYLAIVVQCEQKAEIGRVFDQILGKIPTFKAIKTDNGLSKFWQLLTEKNVTNLFPDYRLLTDAQRCINAYFWDQNSLLVILTQFIRTDVEDTKTFVLNNPISFENGLGSDDDVRDQFENICTTLKNRLKRTEKEWPYQAFIDSFAGFKKDTLGPIREYQNYEALKNQFREILVAFQNEPENRKADVLNLDLSDNVKNFLTETTSLDEAFSIFLYKDEDIVLFNNAVDDLTVGNFSFKVLDVMADDGFSQEALERIKEIVGCDELETTSTGENNSTYFKSFLTKNRGRLPLNVQRANFNLDQLELLVTLSTRGYSQEVVPAVRQLTTLKLELEKAVGKYNGDNKCDSSVFNTSIRLYNGLIASYNRLQQERFLKVDIENIGVEEQQTDYLDEKGLKQTGPYNPEGQDCWLNTAIACLFHIPNSALETSLRAKKQIQVAYKQANTIEPQEAVTFHTDFIQDIVAFQRPRTDLSQFGPICKIVSKWNQIVSDYLQREQGRRYGEVSNAFNGLQMIYDLDQLYIVEFEDNVLPEEVSKFTLTEIRKNAEKTIVFLAGTAHMTLEYFTIDIDTHRLQSIALFDGSHYTTLFYNPADQSWYSFNDLGSVTVRYGTFETATLVYRETNQSVVAVTYFRKDDPMYTKAPPPEAIVVPSIEADEAALLEWDQFYMTMSRNARQSWNPPVLPHVPASATGDYTEEELLPFESAYRELGEYVRATSFE